MLICLAISIVFKSELHQISLSLLENFGFWSFGLLVFVSDACLSIFPPDLLLIILSNSQLDYGGWVHVISLAFISILAGNFAWYLGKRFQSTKLVSKFVRDNREISLVFGEYGSWAVVIGALTPLPFAVSCLCAGVFQLKWHQFFVASLARLPRFIIYYFIIKSSFSLGGNVL